MIQELQKQVEQLRREASQAKSSWDEPQELIEELHPVDPFDLDMLPTLQSRDFVKSISDRLQCPQDFGAVSVIGTIGGATGRRIQVKPKQQDTWQIPLNMYSAICGVPAVAKSPAMQAAMAAIHRFTKKLDLDYEKKMLNYEIEMKVYSARKKNADTQAATLLKKNRDADIASLFEGLDEPKPPIRETILINETTIQRSIQIMSENPMGILVARDEVAGWFYELEQERNKGAREFYLTGFDGVDSYRYETISRGTETCDPLISIMGTIQPGKLSEFLSKVMDGGASNDGLMQRFSLFVYPDVTDEYNFSDNIPASTEWLDELIEAIYAIKEPRVLSFDQNAYEYYKEKITEFEIDLRKQRYPEAIESHFGKYRRAVITLAGIFHVMGNFTSNLISEKYIRLAFVWLEYLKTHALRIYGFVIDPSIRNARVLLEALKELKIKKVDVSKSFSVRELQRLRIGSKVGLTNSKAITAALNCLVEHGWARIDDRDYESAISRKVQDYFFNPRIFA